MKFNYYVSTQGSNHHPYPRGVEDFQISIDLARENLTT
jgi:hypothetical protein